MKMILEFSYSNTMLHRLTIENQNPENSLQIVNPTQQQINLQIKWEIFSLYLDEVRNRTIHIITIDFMGFSCREDFLGLKLGFLR